VRALGITLWVGLASCGRGGFDPPSDGGGAGRCLVEISGNARSTCALLEDGTLRCWGSNTLGQLGDGTIGPSPVPIPVLVSVGGPVFADVVEISAGVEDSACARRSDGTAWCWGWNADGQLGDGTTMNRSSPVQVMAAPGVPLSDVVEIASAEWHACARKADGSVWCWGKNSRGQLGNPAVGAASLVPVQVELATGGPLVAEGLVLSAEASYAWSAGGQLYAWGGNQFGQLGIGGFIDKPAANPVAVSGVVSVGSACCHICASTATGYVYCWGRNASGQLGDGTTTASDTPVPTLEAPGGAPFTGVAQIAGGDNHTCARRIDGSVWCWGSNTSGQIGRPGPQSVSPVPVTLPGPATYVATGNAHSCAIVDGEIALCWGLNSDGQLGDGGFANADMPVAVALACP
jgi:alpha-tubulin suppressor-like RCC1 family protein